MLSILVPVYNFDVNALARELKRQCDGCAIEYEIFLCDDASHESERRMNGGILSLDNVKFKQLEKNHGRARIRNLMAAESRYDNLLFMDCDSEVVKDDYIKSYLPYCGNNNVVCGGRVYSLIPPVDKNKRLRWKTGKKKEEIDAAVRNRNSYRSFMTNNFLIPKNSMLSNLFDESITGYGHEDTLFGFQLKRKKIKVVHIDNPLLHTGLEDAKEFLTKTDNATANLWQIWKSKRLSEKELKEIPLMKTYLSLRKKSGHRIARSLVNSFQKKIRKNLLSENPSVFLFDVYKIGKMLTYR
jgi:cellulose synthase/poly-beta-1,6-N-acetylglucosamine synthase-like glycosyltransferase